MYTKLNCFADIISVGVGDVVTSKVHSHKALIKVSLLINSHELSRHVSAEFCTAHREKSHVCDWFYSFYFLLQRGIG